jgi:two-component system, NarL family, response regulator LiaR
MMTEEKIKVLIVDDHQVVREGLRSFLELLDDIAVIGEAEDGSQAVELVRALKPDVVLMDLVMPHMDGISATRQVLELNLGTKVIALTSFSEDDMVFPAIQAGASSYLLKNVSPDVLAEAIRAVHRGEARLHPDIARKLMQQVSQPRNAAQENSLSELTEREKEVLRLVARGCNNREIAQELCISESTVKTHVSNVLGKLGLDQRTQLVLYAIKNKLVDAS